MKKWLMMLLFALFACNQANAVLKEKDLTRTMGVLRAELEEDYKKQKMFMQIYEQMSTAQHANLVTYMKRSEQIGLILFSQSTDYTFDMAYACQQATLLYHELKKNNLPYDRIKEKAGQNIERYEKLISLLEKMPPAIGKPITEISEVDSVMMEASKDSDAIENAAKMTLLPNKEKKEDTGPFMLTEDEIKSREDCILYAKALMNNLKRLLNSLNKDSKYYEAVSQQAEALNAFAESRYKILQNNIFVEGSNNYIALLISLPFQWEQIKTNLEKKYSPIKDKNSKSEWRGMYVLFISIFAVIYLLIALGITYIILNWILPRKWRTAEFKLKRQLLTNVIGTALFAIIVMVIRNFAQRNFIQMGTGLMINMAWLLEATFLSLYIRLKGQQMRHAAIVYTPYIAMSMLIIMMRIILVPNIILNYVFAPLMLLITIWQIKVTNRNRSCLPQADVALILFTTFIMASATAMGFVGYSFMGVIVLLWWTFQLASIQTISCLYTLMESYRNKYLVGKINPALKRAEKEGKDIEDEKQILLERMQQGKHIQETWLYDFFHKTAIPIMGVISILASIVWAAEIFQMVAACKNVFFHDFLHAQGVMRVSLAKLCLIAALWFVFRYINYSVRSFYNLVRKNNLTEGQNFNATLAKNVIAILVWGAYIIFAMVMLEVPRDGISVITAGLATGMGFAMKDLLENFFYGLSLMTGRLHVGDYIECDGIRGKVESITYQSTQIITIDGCVIAFLNSALFSKNFKNLTRNHRYELVKIPIGVAYGSNVQQVREMLLAGAKPLCEESSRDGMPITNPDTPVSVVFGGFGDSSVDLLMCCWVLVEESAGFQARMREMIYNVLNANNIEIPFPQRDLNIRQMPQ